MPELAQHLAPVHLAVGNLVQLFLEMGGEVVFDVARKIGLQESRHDAAAVFGNEALAVELHIVTALQDFNDAGIGRWPSDAEFLQLLDQARLGIARRRLGEMLLRNDLAALERLVLADVGQDAGVLVFLALLVASFIVQRQEAVEAHDRTGGAQLHGLVGAGDVDRHLVEHGAFHLARHGALPDQLVEAELVLVQVCRHVLRRAEQVGRSDRLVRLLGVLGLGGVEPAAPAADSSDRTSSRSAGGSGRSPRARAARRRYACR